MSDDRLPAGLAIGLAARVTATELCEIRAFAVECDHRVGAIQAADVDDLAVETVGVPAGGGDRTGNRRRPAGPVLEAAVQSTVVGVAR